MINKVKRFFFWIEDNFPFLGRSLISLLRFLRFNFFYRPIFLFSKFRKRKEDLFMLYWIDPKQIELAYDFGKEKVRMFKEKNRGKVMGGDWDLSTKRIEDKIVYKGVKERFVYGKPWRETILYKKGLERIEQGFIFNGCHTKGKLNKYFEHVERLYKSIKEKGYIPRCEDTKIKAGYNKTDHCARKFDEIKIGIGRNGQILFIDGAHRLSIAKFLGIEKVAVRIFFRHKRWVDFKNKLFSFASKHGGLLYQPAYHFDLGDISYSFGDERFCIIKENLKAENGTVLDIGANLGYFCHRFEEIGFECSAVEINPENIYFMKKLRNANGDKFTIIQKSIFDYKKQTVLNFDIILALNIFHHFLKRESDYKKLIQLLKRIKSRELFLETHNPHEKQMEGAYKNYSPEEFIEFILKNSCFEKSQLISSLENGRRLYKLFLK
jgi:hypothetical protein